MVFPLRLASVWISIIIELPGYFVNYLGQGILMHDGNSTS